MLPTVVPEEMEKFSVFAALGEPMAWEPTFTLPGDSIDTRKLPDPVNVEVVVSVAVIVCVPAVSRVTLVWPVPLESVSVPGFTNPASELVNPTVPL
jgi:hypothetical protein